jgi:hypothetical protein
MELKERIATLFQKYNVNLSVEEPTTEATEEVKFAEGKLEDGTMIYTDAEAWEAGVNIYIMNDEGEKIAVPTGDYILEDGRAVAVVDGVVESISEAEATEEEAEKEEKEEMQEEAPLTKEDVLGVINKAVDILREEFAAQLKAKDEEIKELKENFSHNGLPKAVEPVKSISREEIKNLDTKSRVNALFNKYN